MLAAIMGVLTWLLAVGAASAAATTTATERAPHTHDVGSVSRRVTDGYNATMKSGAALPEYVDPVLLARLDALRSDFAHTTRVPSMNRARFVSTFTAATERSVAVLVGGVTEEREGSDTEILFRQESNFIYLTGFDHPGATVVVATGDDVTGMRKGDAWLFVPHGNAVWQGRSETLQDFMDKYDITEAFWIEDLEKQLNSADPDTVFTFSGVEVYIPPAAEQDMTALRAALGTARRIKTAGEIEMIRAASDISAESHNLLMKHIRCGAYESDAESLFRFVDHNYGARFQAYIPIIGGGAHSAALHYNDNDDVIPAGGLVLIDAGAEVGGTRKGGGWTTDITRTWPCNGKFSTLQRGVYEAVFNAQSAAMALVRPGSSMSACTSASDRALVQGLLDAGLLRGGTVDQLIAAGMHRVFMPHGLGHSVGLDVHDPGGISPFAAGMVVTIEPGIYFIDVLLDNALASPTQSRFLDPAVVAKHRGFGGVRIEDTLLVTTDGHENLSGGIPRTIDGIEAWMRAGASAPAVAAE